MDTARFEAMVARLETESRASPRRYQWQVAALALLGFGLLALLMLGAGVGLLVVVGAVAGLFWVGGAAAWLLLFKLGKLAVLFVIPAWLALRHTLRALFTRLPAPQGRALSRAEAPALFQALDGMRQRMRGPKVHHVLVTDEVNAGIVQRPLLGLFGFSRNYLLLGLPLLESMTPQEALAVVAHEYGHLCGSHGRFGAFIYRLRNTWGTIQAHAEQWRGWGGRLMRRAVEAYAPFFNAYTFVLARAQEYEADAASARLVGAEAAASALKRVNVTSAHHNGFFDEIIATTRVQALPPADLALRWAAVATLPPAKRAGPWLDRALDRTPRAMDTHPSLRQRLQALGLADAQLVAPPLQVNGLSAAQAWLGDTADTLRHHAQARWAEVAEDQWKQQHQKWAELREELATLDALPEPDADQQRQQLRLRLDLHPEQDWRADATALNQQHPEHALGVYLAARALLAQDDPAGLALLEQAITLDADATRPACQIAHEWLIDRDPAAARPWAERWQHRADFEHTRQQQIDTLDKRNLALLQAPAPAAETLDEIKTLIAEHGQAASGAWLLRREIPVDPSCVVYVIVLQFKLARLRSEKVNVTVQRLARREWPVGLHLCAESHFPGWLARARRVGVSLK